MSKALAVNAIIIFADRPAELSCWYRENLGIVSRLNPADSRYYGELGAWGDGTPVYFGIYPNSAPLGNAPRATMINFRVADLSGAILELKAKGVQVESMIEESFGDFAHLRDPEGNHIELWMEKPLHSE